MLMKSLSIIDESDNVMKKLREQMMVEIPKSLLELVQFARKNDKQSALRIDFQSQEEADLYHAILPVDTTDITNGSVLIDFLIAYFIELFE